MIKEKQPLDEELEKRRGRVIRENRRDLMDRLVRNRRLDCDPNQQPTKLAFYRPYPSGLVAVAGFFSNRDGALLQSVWQATDVPAGKRKFYLRLNRMTLPQFV